MGSLETRIPATIPAWVHTKNLILGKRCYSLGCRQVKYLTFWRGTSVKQDNTKGDNPTFLKQILLPSSALPETFKANKKLFFYKSGCYFTFHTQNMFFFTILEG